MSGQSAGGQRVRGPGRRRGAGVGGAGAAGLTAGAVYALAASISAARRFSWPSTGRPTATTSNPSFDAALPFTFPP